MRYYKNIQNGYIVAIGTGPGNIEITSEEHACLHSVIQSRPVPPDKNDYRLTVDLEWELFELPLVEETDEEISDEEALAIILGGEA